MMEATKTLCSKDGGDTREPYATRQASPCLPRWAVVLTLLFAGLTAGLPLPARAEPVANTIFTGCTFTTGSHTTRGTLNSVLNISQTDLNQLAGGEIQASYILIYVRQSPNEGQDLANSALFTGPILCRNLDTTVTPTTETTLIPGAGVDSVNILGAEEVSHLQYEPNVGNVVGRAEKRVCHTVASNTNCFLIRPSNP